MDKVLEERLAAKDSYIDIHDFYVLMAFYQSISQKVLRKFDKDGSILEVQKKYEEGKETVQDAQFVIAPQDTYYHHYQMYKANKFEYVELVKSLYNIEEKNPKLKNIFQDVRGSTSSLPSETAFEKIDSRNEVSFEENLEIIKRSSGAKDNYDYTSKNIRKLITKLVGSKKEGVSIYDPALGTASLLLGINRAALKENKYYGQEINTQVIKIAIMNAIINDVADDKFEFKNANTLANNWEFGKADIVVSDPPMSMKWNIDKNLSQDKRYQDYGDLPNRADWGFILDGINKLSDDGMMVVSVVQGTLFRGAKEYDIRRKLLENGKIRAVIQLPGNTKLSTTIATCLLVFRKSSEDKDVFFINASQEYEKKGLENILTEANVDKIVDTFNEKKEVQRFSHMASYEEIEKNDFNLSVARYVNQYKFKEKLDYQEEIKNLEKLDEKLSQTDETLKNLMGNLGLMEIDN